MTLERGELHSRVLVLGVLVVRDELGRHVVLRAHQRAAQHLGRRPGAVRPRPVPQGQLRGGLQVGQPQLRQAVGARHQHVVQLDVPVRHAARVQGQQAGQDAAYSLVGEAWGSLIISCEHML